MALIRSIPPRAGLAGAARFLLAGLLVAGLAAPGAPARAAGWAVSVDLPVQFVFTGSFGGVGSASGYQVGLTTPWRIGIGTTGLSADAEDSSQSIQTTVEYRFTNVYLDLQGSRMRFVAGYGTGTATMEPFTVLGSTFSIADANATQTFVQLGWPLGPTWEVHVGYHRIAADQELLVNGTPSGTRHNLDGIAHSLGLQYGF